MNAPLTQDTLSQYERYQKKLISLSRMGLCQYISAPHGYAVLGALLDGDGNTTIDAVADDVVAWFALLPNSDPETPEGLYPVTLDDGIVDVSPSFIRPLLRPNGTVYTGVDEYGSKAEWLEAMRASALV